MPQEKSKDHSYDNSSWGEHDILWPVVEALRTTIDGFTSDKVLFFVHRVRVGVRFIILSHSNLSCDSFGWFLKGTEGDSGDCQLFSLKFSHFGSVFGVCMYLTTWKWPSIINYLPSESPSLPFNASAALFFFHKLFVARKSRKTKLYHARARWLTIPYYAQYITEVLMYCQSMLNTTSNI